MICHIDAYIHGLSSYQRFTEDDLKKSQKMGCFLDHVSSKG